MASFGHTRLFLLARALGVHSMGVRTCRDQEGEEQRRELRALHVAGWGRDGARGVLMTGQPQHALETTLGFSDALGGRLTEGWVNGDRGPLGEASWGSIWRWGTPGRVRGVGRGRDSPDPGPGLEGIRGVSCVGETDERSGLPSMLCGVWCVVYGMCVCVWACVVCALGVVGAMWCV